MINETGEETAKTTHRPDMGQAQGTGNRKAERSVYLSDARYVLGYVVGWGTLKIDQVHGAGRSIGEEIGKE